MLHGLVHGKVKSKPCAVKERKDNALRLCGLENGIQGKNENRPGNKRAVQNRETGKVCHFTRGFNFYFKLIR
jgi:hypothetical protein